MTKPTQIKPIRKTKKLDAKKNTGTNRKKTSAPVILPIYLNPGNAQISNKQKEPQPVYVPDSGSLLNAHQQSLDAGTLKSSPNAADNILTAESGAYGEVQWLDVSASIAGENGALQMHDTFIFDPTAAPEDVLITHNELNLPPEFGRTNPYPIQFYFKREVSYADKKGRILSMEYIATMGFTFENWRNQAGIIIDTSENQWDRLRYMQADEASSSLFIDGRGLTGEQYFAYGFADGASIRFDELYLSLNTGLTDIKDLDITMLVRPETGAGYQFGKLHDWLNQVDSRRWKEAHPDKAWYEHVGDFLWGAGKSIYNNTVGAVYQAGLQLADMERLWIAVQLKALGIADYTPSMWSDMGKAAEQGATTTDLLVGMGKGMVLAPYRFVKAVQRGDAEGAGEALADTAFAIEGARGSIKSVPHILRAGKRGFGKLRTAIPSLKAGLRDFHANLRNKGNVIVSEGAYKNSGSNKYRHSMADAGKAPDSLAPPEVYGPITPEQAQLDTSHYDWMDQMHAATRGEAPEPPAWRGPTPKLDAKGRWTGWSPAEAYAAFRHGVDSHGGQFEVIIARDRMNGQYEVMIGDRGGVSPSANTPGRFWDTVMHYHPNFEAAPRFTIPAQKDMWSGMQTALNAPLPDGRPHIEFVESTLNGKTTRTAIVMGGKGQHGRVDIGPGVLGRSLADGSASIKFTDNYLKFWRSQDGGTPQQSYPGDPVWVPPESQAYRNLMTKAAESLGHKDLAEKIKAQSPEDTGSPLTEEPGSVYFNLKDFGLPPRFMNSIGDDEVADLTSMRIVQSASELRELMKKSRLAGGFYSNGQPLDPTRDLQGSAYWLVIQGKKGELWLVPHYLLEKKL